MRVWAWEVLLDLIQASKSRVTDKILLKQISSYNFKLILEVAFHFRFVRFLDISEYRLTSTVLND